MDNFRIAQCRYDSMSQYGPLSASEHEALRDRLERLLTKKLEEELDEIDEAWVTKEIEEIRETLREEW